jgi:hypothetical protein
MTGGTFTLRRSVNAFIVSKSDMNDAALVRSHGAKLHATVLTGGLISCITSNRFQLFALTALITLNINDNRITETNCTNGNSGNQELQSIKGFTMTTNKNRKVVASDVENQLTLIALIFIDGDVTNIEMLENILKSSDSGICDPIKIFLADSVIFRSLSGFHLLLHFRFNGFFLNLFLSHDSSFTRKTTTNGTFTKRVPFNGKLLALRRVLLLRTRLLNLASDINFNRLHIDDISLLGILALHDAHGNLLLSDTDK